MINLCCAAVERKRDVIQEVVGSASEILSECSPYSGFTLVPQTRPAGICRARSPQQAQLEERLLPLSALHDLLCNLVGVNV